MREAEDLRDDVRVVLLGVDDALQRERARLDDDADDRERERDLVGDELRDRAQAAEQGVLRAAGPAADEHAVEAHRADRRHVQERHVGVGDREVDVLVRARDGRLAAERHQRERGERGEHRDERRGQVERRCARRRGSRSACGSSLPRSAIGCSRPIGPTRLGPWRVCSRPISLRSKTVMKAKKRHQPVDEDEGLDHGDERRRRASGLLPRSCRRRRPAHRPRRSAPLRGRACARASPARSSCRPRGAP